MVCPIGISLIEIEVDAYCTSKVVRPLMEKYGFENVWLFCRFLIILVLNGNLCDLFALFDFYVSLFNDEQHRVLSRKI